MSNEQRLENEKQNLLAIAESVEHVSVEILDSYNRSYKIVFDVSSIADFDSGANTFETTDRHEIELNLPVNYPSVEPELRWLTPIFHPNVSLSGYLDINDIGFRWSPEMSLVVICERLWDIARFAWVDTESANNYSAKRKWNEGAFEAPTDNRLLKSADTTPLGNVVHYEKINPAASQPVVETPEVVSAEIIEISGEPQPETPVKQPEVFVIDEKSAPPVIEKQATNDDDDIFIIE